MSRTASYLPVLYPGKKVPPVPVKTFVQRIADFLNSPMSYADIVLYAPCGDDVGEVLLDNSGYHRDLQLSNKLGCQFRVDGIGDGTKALKINSSYIYRDLINSGVWNIWDDWLFTQWFKLDPVADYTGHFFDMWGDPDNYYWAGTETWLEAGHDPQVQLTVTYVANGNATGPGGGQIILSRDVWHNLTIWQTPANGGLLIWVDGVLKFESWDAYEYSAYPTDCILNGYGVMPDVYPGENITIGHLAIFHGSNGDLAEIAKLGEPY